MKSKVLVIMTIVSLLAIMIPGVMIAAASAEELDSEHVYPATFLVTNIQKNKGRVYGVDNNGNIFAWYQTEDEEYHVGDIAAALMHDNGTETVTDDIILEIRYAGKIKNWQQK